MTIRAGVGKSSIINALRFNALADDGDGPSCSGEDEDDIDVDGAAAERLDSHSNASTSAPAPDDGYREAATRPMRAPSGTIGDADGFQVSTAQCCCRTSDISGLIDRIHCSSKHRGRGLCWVSNVPLAAQAVGTISTKLRRGKHTTRSVRLLETRSGDGMLADTPGFNQPSLEGLSVEQLPDSFPEIRARLETARRALRSSLLKVDALRECL